MLPAAAAVDVVAGVQVPVGDERLDVERTGLAHRGLAAVLDCPHVELDGMWWDAGWTEAGSSEFRSRVAAVTHGDRWVVDGNYFSSGARDVVWPLADTVVWLDFSKRRYYTEKQRLYGRGRTASFVCREEARKSGYKRSLLGRR